MSCGKRRLSLLPCVFLLVLFGMNCAAYSSPLAVQAVGQKQAPAEVETTDPETSAGYEEQRGKKSNFFNAWLHMLDKQKESQEENISVLAYGKQVPSDIGQALQSIGQDGQSPGFFGVLLRSLLAIGAGVTVSFFVGRQVRSRIRKIEELKPQETDSLTNLALGVMHNAHSVVSLVLLAILSTFVFLIIGGDVSSEGRMLFQTVLGAVLIITVCRALSGMFLAPDAPEIRLLRVPDVLVSPLHRAIVISLFTLLGGVLLARFLAGLGVQWQTISWVAMILGSVIIFTFCFFIMSLKGPVTDVLLEEVTTAEGGGWLKGQIYQYWHVPSLAYLMVVWFVWLGQLVSGMQVKASTFAVSVLAIPIYLILNSLGKALIGSVVESLQLARVEVDPDNGIDEEEAVRLQNEKQRTITAKVQSVYSVLLALTIFTWVLSLWGTNLPFAQQAMRAIFESLVTVGLALAFWRFASNAIERKIAESTPEEEEQKEEDSDDEFGGAVLRGRSHTLLPMVRKLIGTVLMTMVVLIVISALGVNIGPLLAGAGIVGLAVGFGAQKLVSDVLSGFFFLLDDAFRIGEYIQAGSIRGTVEAITLRNVMLRHHLGMLQVVPHSDLGAVTNYMRGGIVIKFPLEFPYDTDIDKVRKIIKKVGQAMLADEELGDDFIQPVKSQGVYEITNSVMVIRVKFTSKPGKQFVIKREAFRRITEALNAKGIYYAHRKVIVDLPEDSRARALDAPTQQKILEAGAASALASEASSQDAQPKQSSDPME